MIIIIITAIFMTILFIIYHYITNRHDNTIYNLAYDCLHYATHNNNRRRSAGAKDRWIIFLSSSLYIYIDTHVLTYIYIYIHTYIHTTLYLFFSGRSAGAKASMHLSIDLYVHLYISLFLSR